MDSNNLPTFIESICIVDSEVHLLEYHQARVDKAFRTFFSDSQPILLADNITTNNIKDHIIKCRILYNERLKSITYTAYTLTPINSLQAVEINPDYDYSFKYEDRSMLDYFYNMRGDAEDIIMIQNGYVTDSYYGNLAFLKDSKWYTPKSPLLEGTRRAQLIDANQIITQQIHINDVPQYEAVSIYNAMLPLGNIIVPMDAVKL